MPDVETFSRWKYAEEEAKRLIDGGHAIILTNRRVYVYDPDDAEEYESEEFVLIDLGKRHA